MKKCVFLVFIMIMGLCAISARELTDSVCVHFRINDAKLDTTGAANKGVLHDFGHRMDSIMQADTLARIKSVVIYSAASPEGRRAYNEKLSLGRGQSLAKWIKERTGCPDTMFSIMSVGPDWEGFRQIINTDTAHLSAEARADIMGHLGKSTESNPLPAKLRRTFGNKAYNHFKRDYFPELRRARAHITYYLPDPLQQFVPEAVEQEAADSMPVADTVPSDRVVMEDIVPAQPAKRPLFPFAIKTNLLYDLMLTPNLGVEIPIGQRFSVDANWMYARWNRHSAHRFWRIYGGDLAVYYRPGSRRPGYGLLAGHYIGIYGQTAVYDFQFGNHKGVLSDKWNYAVGIGYKYSHPLTPRLNLEFSLGVGVAWGIYKKHRPIDECDVWISTHRLRWFGPTKAGISLVWLIGGRDKDKNRKGGEL